VRIVSLFFAFAAFVVWCTAALSETVIPMVSDGGTFRVPVTINGQLTLKFVIDSGAADVSVPADVVMTLLRTGTITDADFLGKQTYQLADGSTIPSQQFVIRSLKVGDKNLENVVGSVAPVAGGLLLGQSFLSRFNTWSIDNHQRVLILGSPPNNSNAYDNSGYRTAATTVRGFYEALSAGNGHQAATFIVPEKRTGPFSPMAMTDFYGKLVEPLELVSLVQNGTNTFFVGYHFKGNSGQCNGRAIVSTVSRNRGDFISSIKALDGC
jgi:hypothetical protein